MSNKNEPAHPVQTGFGVVSKGMTKRELISAMAMQGILSENSGWLVDDAANTAVAYADALLEALK